MPVQISTPHRHAIAEALASGSTIGGSPIRHANTGVKMNTELRSEIPALTIGKLALAFIGSLAVTGCAGNSSSKVQAPGEPATALTRTLDAGADALQSRPPVAALNAYLDGFHFYNGNMKAQMEAHHYCSILNEEVIQCVIYDGNVKDAKLMGVEYIISERLFATLPTTEQALWHSHVHEIKSGQLIAPGIPGPAEHALMQKLVNTYGKTWHTDQDKKLPLGMPQLMMGFTADGQAQSSISLEARGFWCKNRFASKRKWMTFSSLYSET